MDDRTLWGKIFGQEKNLTTSAIARKNRFRHGAGDFQIVRRDTLRQPAFFSGDKQFHAWWTAQTARRLHRTRRSHGCQ